MNRLFSMFVFFAFYLATSINISATTIIDTFPFVNTTIHSLGEGDGAQTYGQTFIAPQSDTFLKDFSVSIRSFSLGHLLGPTNFDFYIMKWNDIEKHAEGEALYSFLSVEVPVSQQNFTTFSFNPNTNLSSTEKYVAIFTVSNHFDNVPNAVQFECSSNHDSYSGGDFFFIVNVDDFSKIGAEPWNDFFIPYNLDLGFRATFIAEPLSIPEPSTIFLFGLGLIGVARMRQRFE